MWINYLWVFLAAMLVDILPVPLPPAFTVMIFFQIKYDLNIWWVIVIGVIGSIIGRYVLTLYVPYISGRLLKQGKNQDVQYLGEKLKQNSWKSHLFILTYSLMPLPTTPLFLAGGIARMKPYYIIPAFTIGKFISDAIAVLIGDYAAKNTEALLEGIVSWKSITGLVLGLLLVFALLFIDWRVLLKNKKLKLEFDIWKGKNKKIDNN
jgi:uncharacterized membrane protein YdjX (TVP38/TMEM64 family)